MATVPAAFVAAAIALLLAGPGASVAPREVCRNATGTHDGLFFTFWKSSGEACVTLGADGRYAARYRLGRDENLVTGVGWRKGSQRRTVGYRAAAFAPGTNSYLTLYGWSTDPLIEYYVVDSWGSAFKPPGPGERPLGTVTADGGTYEIYRTQRVEKPSIRGTQTFGQYWSVRTEQRPTGADAAITFATHVEAWRELGLELGRMDYQVMATEGFGSSGHSDLTVWEQ